VERLFDQYAPRFDASLVERLHYSAPRAIRRTLEQRFPKRRYATCLDIGCGTGLMGAEIRDLVDRLAGVDLSQGMINQARRKNIYDALSQADAVLALRGTASYDLILAADVLVYLGDLRPIIAAAYDALTPDGVFVFTVQIIKGADFSLGPDQRFSHSENYIMSAMTMFQAVHVTPGTFRRERNEPVPGLLVLAIKTD
jgi:predicted TPR repeat methyltransferase